MSKPVPTRESFIARALGGHILDVDAAIEDEVDAWHERKGPPLTLRDWLGMTLVEYELWTHQPSALRAILTARSQNTDVARLFKAANADGGLNLAARGAENAADYRRIRDWLRATGRL